MTMLRDYQQDLIEDLRGNPGEAALYLAAALEEGDSEVLRLALQDVAEALALTLPKEDGEAICRLIDGLARAGIKLTVKAA